MRSYKDKKIKKNSNSSKTPSYVLTLELHCTISDKKALDKYFELSRRLYNSVLSETLRRFNLMGESKTYRSAKNIKDDKLKQNTYKELEKKYGFREYDLSVFATKLMVNEYSSLGSHIKGKLVKRAFEAVNKLRFGNAKKVNFIGKDYGLNSIESADNKQGIKYRNGFVIFNKLKLPIVIKKNDVYAQIAIQDRVKYCRIIKKEIRGKTRYYVQLILEGVPPIKINKNTGEIKLSLSSGKLGIDIGTQTIAYSSQHEVGLRELAPEINNIDHTIKLLQRKMDRSRRSTNPNKYNENGTIKKGNKDKWIYSRNYMKIKSQRKDLYRKQTEIRKNSHEKLANYLIRLAEEFYVENMNYQGLQRRVKETTVNNKGRYNKKKRFGKSLANKAPSMFLTTLDRKLKYFDKELNKINTYKIKASQYNHIKDEYNKKELKDRWNDFGEFKIQRDLYSSFLIMCTNKDLNTTSKELCNKEFGNFKLLHDKEIERLRELKGENKKLISSMGI